MLNKSKTNTYDLNYHLVFVTKYRQPMFTDDTKRESMKQYLRHIANNNEVAIQHLEVVDDHVHLLISFKPKYAPASIVKAFKGASAREWFKAYPKSKNQLWKGHLWSSSYFISTIGNVSEKIVKQYIENQMRKR